MSLLRILSGSQAGITLYMSEPADSGRTVPVIDRRYSMKMDGQRVPVPYNPPGKRENRGYSRLWFLKYPAKRACAINLICTYGIRCERFKHPECIKKHTTIF